MQQFLNDDNATRINISKHERSRDNTLENSSWSNYAPFPPLPHSKPPLNFIPIFFDSIFVVCSVRNENVLFARGDSTAHSLTTWIMETADCSHEQIPQRVLCCPPDSRLVLLVLKPSLNAAARLPLALSHAVFQPF